MTQRALIVVDFQNDYFPNGKWTLSGIDAAADNATRIVAAARKAGDQIIYMRHEFIGENAPFFAAGSEGAQLHPKFRNGSDEQVVVKNHVNSFQGTDLKQILDRKGIKDIVVCGAMSHMCIDAITRAATDFGYKVSVIHDACATHDLEFNGVKVPAAQVHAAFMAALAFAYATLHSTDEYLQSAGTANAA